MLASLCHLRLDERRLLLNCEHRPARWHGPARRITYKVLGMGRATAVLETARVSCERLATNVHAYTYICVATMS